MMSIDETIEWLKENKSKLLTDADDKKQSALVVIKAYQIYMTVKLNGQDVSGPTTLNLVNAVQDYIEGEKPEKKMNKWERKRNRDNARRVQKNLAKIQKNDDILEY